MTISEAVRHISQQVETQLADPVEETVSPLQILHQVVEDAGHHALFNPSENASPLAKVFIAASRWQDQLLFIKFVSLSDIAILTGAAMGDESPAPELLQGSLVMPFSVPAQSIPDVARAILLINRLLPACSFGMSDTDGTIYLQGTLMIEPGTFPAVSAQALVEQMLFAIELHVPLLAEVADSQISFTGLAERLRELGFQPGPVPVAAYPKVVT